MAKTNNPAFLQSKQVAELLGVPIQTVHEWLRSKKLPGFKVGAKWFIRADDFTNITPQRVKPIDPRPLVMVKAEVIKLVKSKTVFQRLVEMGLKPVEENKTRIFYRRETVEHYLRMLDNQKR